MESYPTWPNLAAMMFDLAGKWLTLGFWDRPQEVEAADAPILGG